MSTCKQWREGDENVCTCGFRWDINEDDPHPPTLEEYHQAKGPEKRLYPPQRPSQKGRETLDKLRKELDQ